MKKILLSAALVAAALAVAYLATMGSCHLAGVWKRAGAWSDRLGLTPEQKRKVAGLEESFARQRGASCETLCAKRAQMIALLKQPEPDRAALSGIVEEIGAEQTALEKATLEHILAVAAVLDPERRGKLIAQVSEELRAACKGTACGMGPGCSMRDKNR